jgi:E3 ubiquitin-protein ligase RNF38/44
MLCQLDETVENRKGATVAQIETLPAQTVPAGGLLGEAGEKLSCAVCLEEFVEGAQLRALPCLHKYHKDCIDKWLQQKAACPVCNRAVSS